MASRFRHKYRIETTRLNGYDYSKPGNYFITICTKDREQLFGEIMNEKIILSETGKIVSECWLDLPNHYPNIILDEFMVMPNHFHGIIIIRNGSDNNLKHGLSEIIRAFKSFSSRRINKLNTLNVETGLRPVSTSTTSYIWQPRFYDRIIRSDNELNRIRVYIKNNPKKLHHNM
jgi:REP element-mobilizing transposase RayT